MIRFGSRVDVYLPEGGRRWSAEGQTAIAGETVLADCGGEPARAIASADRGWLTAPFAGVADAGGRTSAILPLHDAFSPFDPDRPAIRRRRFRPIPVRMLVPNLVTLLALCAGLTAIRLAVEDKLEWAVAAIVFAAVLDGIDGRLARLLKGTSRFGAELDSLADFVNFGVAPALILYFWGLHDSAIVGWIAALVFAICGGAAARPLQRDDRRSEPAGLGRQFLRRRAGAGRRDHGAAADLRQSARRPASSPATLTLLYTLAIALLMVSRLPVFSGKRVGKRVPPEMVLPVFVLVVLFFALLIAYPWEVLTSARLLSRLPAARLGLLQGVSAQGRMSAAQATRSGRSADAGRAAAAAGGGSRTSGAVELERAALAPSIGSNMPAPPAFSMLPNGGTASRRYAHPLPRPAPRRAASCSA